MTRRMLLAILISLAIVVALIWLFVNTRAEPVGAISRKWESSGHADRTAEAFTHWDEDQPPLIPAECAKCHSTMGYLDFLGEDGSTAQAVDEPAQTGTVLYCNVCHNNAAQEMRTVVFPSGAEVTGLTGFWGNCMQCHQGLASTETVRQAIAGLEDDIVQEELGFINVHYFVAAATAMGARVRGAYQYEGREYVGYYEHVVDLNTCTECHDVHSLSVDPNQCSPCHVNVTDSANFYSIRTSKTDWDGDGETKEGIAEEIETLHGALYEAIQEYAATVIAKPIVYAPGSFPYFFIDLNGNGNVDGNETNPANAYDTWTPRLVRTAYNYHYVYQDPGAFAHNPYYTLQILYDSLADLAEVVPVDLDEMVRPSGY